MTDGAGSHYFVMIAALTIIFLAVLGLALSRNEKGNKNAP
jgi:cbb3-type cytochrome oxidase subunit 3